MGRLERISQMRQEVERELRLEKAADLTFAQAIFKTQARLILYGDYFVVVLAGYLTTEEAIIAKRCRVGMSWDVVLFRFQGGMSKDDFWEKVENQSADLVTGGHGL